MASRLLKCWPPLVAKGGAGHLSSQVPYVISQDGNYLLIMVGTFHFIFLNSVVTVKKY